MEAYTVEPLDLMQFINTKYHEPFIHARIELESPLDAARLTDALERLVRVFPLLQCSYDSEANVYVRQDDLDVHRLIRVTDQENRIELITESLDMRQKLIQFTIAGSTLYCTVSHLVCDGSGFKQLLYLLCELYNGERSLDCSYLMNRSFSQLTKGLSAPSGTLQMLLSMMGNYKNTPIYSKTEEEARCIIERKILKPVMDKAHAHAKQQGATLNDVFLTAYARALCMLHNSDKVNIPCTVDLRKYADGNTGIANLTGTYNLNLKIQKGESFDKTLSAASAAMQKQKATRNDIAGPRLLVSKYAKTDLNKFLKLYGGMQTSAYTDYTNLGILDDEKLHFHAAAAKNAVVYAGLNKAPCFQLAISSFRGETSLTSLFQCGTQEQRKAERLIDAIIAEIEKFSES